jgi:hypothetical protein
LKETALNNDGSRSCGGARKRLRLEESQTGIISSNLISCGFVGKKFSVFCIPVVCKLLNLSAIAKIQAKQFNTQRQSARLGKNACQTDVANLNCG